MLRDEASGAEGQPVDDRFITMPRAKPAHTVALRIANSQPRPVTFCLEPWGEVYEMPRDAVFEVVGRGPEGDSLEVNVTDGNITVYGWAGSVVELSYDGAELGPAMSDRLPVPES
jgi:hypothetical protein